MFGRLAVLLSSIAAGCLVLLPLAYYWHGGIGVAAATVAAVLCALCGAAAVVLSEALRPQPKLAMYEVLTSAVLRMAIPLIVCMVIYHQGGALVEGQFVFYLLAFYALMLLAEIVYIVRVPIHWKPQRRS